MKKYLIGFFIVLGMSFLFGCSSSKEDESTTVVIEKDGKITGIIVEEFGESYYDETDLKNYTLNAVAEYNAVNGEKSIEVSKLETVKNADTVSVIMKYKTAQDYEKFNGQLLFAGTVEEAYEAGHDLDVTLVDMQKPENSIKKSDILELGNKHIVIAEEAVLYKIPGKALYISENAESIKRTVVFKKDASEDGYIYIIY